MNFLPSPAPRFLAAILLAACIGSLPLHAAKADKVAAAARSSKGVTFHVATDGNDAWSGLQPKPNQARTDGPWATLEHARDQIRALRKTLGVAAEANVRILVHGGTHFLKAPLVLTQEDAGAESAPLRILAAPGARPVLSGGQRITDWRPVEFQGKAVWAADLPAVREGRWYFHQLWIDGQRRTRARHPDRGYLGVAAVPATEGDWTKGQNSFQFRDGDLKAWPGATQGEVVVMNRWVESRLPIREVRETDHTIGFSKRSVFKLEKDDLYYVEGTPEAMDTPGEWYLDRAAGTLYYFPFPNESPREAEVIAPVLPQLLRMEGDTRKGHLVEHITFDGLTFAHTEWYYPDGFTKGETQVEIHPAPAPEVGGFAQAAIGVPAAVRGSGVRFCQFLGCSFTHLGGYALDLGRGCRHNRVAGCNLSDLGGGGIKLGETAIRDHIADVAAENEVTDCDIRDGGRIFHSAIGVWIGQSPGNRIAHCNIHDFYYTGISAGWTWGYSRALATNTIVEWNYVHHIGRRADGDGPILSDMAGIYTLGLHTGSVIRNNLWHDSAATRYGGWGIYFDEGTTGILAENNVVYRTTHGGFHQHYGKENVVQNNIFAFAREHQIQRTRVEPHLTVKLDRNIVYWDNGSPLFGGDLSDTQFAFDHNIYWRTTGGELKFGKRSLKEWQAIGMDNASVIADPQFVDVANGDFTLRPDSPALRLGFKPIDLRGVGVRADWRKH